MSRWILIYSMFLATAALAAEATPPSNPISNIEILGYGLDLHGFVQVTYQNKYVWRGFDIYDGASGFEPAAGVEFGDSGLGAMVTGHRANPAGHELQERWDYNIYYHNTIFKGEPIEADCRVGWVYYNFPEWPSKVWDLQEMHASIQLPKALGIKGLIPGYTVVKLWPAHENSPSLDHRASGSLHTLSLDYNLSLPGPLPTIPEQVIKFHGEITFNDGVSMVFDNGPGMALSDVDHDWSHGLIGISTDFNLGYGITLTPAVYHQLSMDDTVDNEDETWFTVGARWAF